MQIIDNKLLNSISAQAKLNPRLRQNFNLHETLDDHVQRLLNAMEPGTELPVHRHTNTDETYVVIRGKLQVKLYNIQKELIQVIVLDPSAGNYGVSIPAGQWHTVEVLEENTVILEVKEGPYCPLKQEDILVL